MAVTTATFSLLGFPHLTISEAADRTAAMLGITFVLHDSSYLGGEYYLWKNSSGAKIAIQKNFRDEEGWLAENDFPDVQTLGYASYMEITELEPLVSDYRCSLLRTVTRQRKTRS